MDAADDWFGDEGDFNLLYQIDHQLVAEGAVEFEDHYQDHLEDSDNNENNDNDNGDSSDFDIDLDDYHGELVEVDLDDNHNLVDNDIDLSDIDDDPRFEFRDLSLDLEEVLSEEEGHFHFNIDSDGPQSPRHPIQSPHSPQSPSSSESSLVDADPGFDIDLDLPYDFEHDSGLDIPGVYSSNSSGFSTDIDEDSENDDNEQEDEDEDNNEDTSNDDESDYDSDSSVERRVREQFNIFEASARIEARLDELEQRRQLFVQGLAEARRQFESIAGEEVNRREQNRHHPYRVPALLDRRRAQQQQQQQGGGGLLGLGEGPAAPRNNNADRLDELVEMEVGWPGGRRADRRTPAAAADNDQNNNNDNPAQQDNQVVIDLTSDLEDSDDAPLRIGRSRVIRRHRPSASVEARRAARRAMSANANNNGAAAGGAPANQAGNEFPEVIDLTQDDDDPAPAGPAAGHRRRGNIERSRRPVNRRPAANELIVDLGEVNSDDDDAIARAAHRPPAARNFFGAPVRPPAAAGRAARAGGGGLGGAFDNFFQLIRMGAFANVRPDLEVQLIGLDANNNPLGRNIPNFDYGNNGRNRGAAAAAAAAAEQARNALAPPPARPGFTRATGEDLAIVCPSCEEELAYDQDEEDQKAGQAPTPKKARTRKDREEHFFWAVKECGHVSISFLFLLSPIHHLRMRTN